MKMMKHAFAFLSALAAVLASGVTTLADSGVPALLLAGVPMTGDNRWTKVLLFVGVGILALAALILCAVLPAVKKKKSEKSEENPQK